jgi:PTS system mannitol-specific IIC component
MSQSISAASVKTIIFACEAGMGSSLMSVNALKRKMSAAHLQQINILNKPAREVPADAQLIIVHKGLAKIVRAKAPNAVILSFFQFLDDPIFDRLVKALVENAEIVSNEP